MTDQILTVRPGAGTQTATIAAVVASLPKALRLHADGQLASIDGIENWCADAMTVISSGVRGLIINRPAIASAVAIEELVGLAKAQGVSVLVRGRWSGHTALAAFQPAMAVSNDTVLVDCFASGSTGDDWNPLLDQLFLLEKMIGRLDRLACDSMTSVGHIWRARTAKLHLPISIEWASDGLGPRVTLQLLGRDSFQQAIVEDTPLWLPVSTLSATEAGEHHRALVYESADRTIWQRLYAEVTRGSVDVHDLELLATCVRQLGRTSEGDDSNSFGAAHPSNLP